jgi:hypothetical protein
MHLMSKWQWSAIALVGLAGSLGLAGCAIEPAEESIGEAPQEQVPPGSLIWRSVVFTFADPSSTELGKIYIFNRAFSGYTTGTEYWYVDRDSLGLLGSYGLSITTTDHTAATTPVDPGYSSEQTFTQPVNPTGGWGTGWTSDPVSGGSLHGGPNSHYLRLKTGGTPLGVSNVTWYQVLPNTATPANITPNGTFSLTTGVSVPTGHLGYSISQ